MANWRVGRVHPGPPTAPPNPGNAKASVAGRLREWQDAKDREWSLRHATGVNRIVRQEIVPALGKRALRTTTRADWIELITVKKRTAPAMASLLYRTISAFLNYAEAAGWINAPLLPRRGAATLAPAPSSRDRVLTDAELRAIWHSAGTLTPRSRVLIRLLILTGARLSEVADMHPSEIDLDAGRWTLPGPRSKNRMSYTMPLLPLAIEEWNHAGAELRGFRGFSKLKRAIDAASNVLGWRFHDIRRTVRTGMTKLGIPRAHAEAAINHIGGRTGVVGVYEKHDYAQEIISALSRWQRHVTALGPG